MFKQKFAIKNMNAILITENTSGTYIPVLTAEQKSTVIAILAENGYRLKKDAFIKFATDKINLYTAKDILNAVVDIKGSDVNHAILIGSFPFPPNESQASRSFLAYLNYASQFFNIPNAFLQEDKELYPLTDDVIYTELDIVDSIDETVKSLFKSKIPLSLDNEEFVAKLYETKDDILNSIDPKEIVLKEILARQIAMELVEKEPEYVSARSAIDVLRAIALISGEENAKLDEQFTIKSLSNPLRRSIIAVLDRVANIDDLASKKSLFKRLFKIIHVHEKKNEKYSNIRALATQLQSINNPRTSRTEIHKIVSGIGTKEGFDIIVGNPSLFIRNLDAILRKHDPESVLQLFTESLKTRDVETKLLVQILAHFRNRGEKVEKRLITLKGKSSPVVVEKPLDAMAEDLISKLNDIIVAELKRQYSKKETYIEKAYIDPELYKINIPSSLSDQDGLKMLSRGSRYKIKQDGDILRLFVHWKDYTDIDLSAVTLDENYDSLENIHFRNLSGSFYEHSGDVRSAPNGGSEFIDIHLDKIPKKHRYVLLCINDYNGKAFDDIPELFTGFMIRDSLTGKNFDARTVVDKFSISGGVGFKYGLMFDVHNREVIMINASKPSSAYDSIYSTEYKSLINEIMNRKYVTVGELLELNTKYVLCEDEQLTMSEEELAQVQKFDSDFGTNVIEITSKLL